jgi:thiopurine S-methyltransferase
MKDPQFWQGRWERGEIGWHQSEAEPRLVENFKSLSPTRVFVPLCGKSLDLVWLHEQGHHVIGAELSQVACRSFFEERGLTPSITEEAGFRVFRAERYTLFQGDFFALTPQILGPIGVIYDRASLIALPREMRKDYVEKLISLSRASKEYPHPQILLITIERVPHDEVGPPHSIQPSEVESLYQNAFRVERLSNELLEQKSPSGSDIHEWVFRIH